MGLSTFIKHIKMIHAYVCRGDSMDALRGAVCGIEFAPNSILVNTRHLKHMMLRSKSCVNMCFQRMGYTACRSSPDISSIFTQILPACRPHVSLARQWCVRKALDSNTILFAPNIPFQIAVDGDATPVEPPPDAAAPFPLDLKNLLNHPAPGAGLDPMPGLKLSPPPL
jgi:hypothetical protein